MAAVLIWVFSIYIGLAVISLTLPYVAFRVERKPNQNTIDDYVRWMGSNNGAKYTTLSWVPIDKMCVLALGMLINNEVITTKMGQTLNIVELLHTTTINTLNSMRLGLETKIKNLILPKTYHQIHE